MNRHYHLILTATLLGCGSTQSKGSDGAATSSGGASSASTNAATTDTGADSSSSTAAADSTNGSSTTAGSDSSTSDSSSSGGSTGGGTSSDGRTNGSGGASSDGSGGATTATTGGRTTAGGEGGSDAGRMTCESDDDCGYFSCCDGYCVNVFNDPFNCGSCGNGCDGDQPFCRSGECSDPPCDGVQCGAGTSCCGNECCGAGQLCCDVTVGPSITGCFDPEFGTCPTGCMACVCASPDTPIATPSGERAIAELAVGDLVYSVDDNQIRAVPIVMVNRVPVEHHRVLRVTFADGAEFEISGGHPTADGRLLSELFVGDSLDGKLITRVTSVPYRHTHTYDILPESSTGAYFASGVLVGSTLAGERSVAAPDL